MAWHNTLLRDEAGNAVGTLSSGEDISERRKAQEALAASERRFKSLVQNASDVTMVWRADGTIAYASPSSERLLGREPVELIDRSVFELLAAGDVEAVRRTLSRLLSLPGRPVAMECRCHHVNGTLLTFEALASNLLNDPDIGGIVVNARDITERVAMERQLQDRAAFEELTAAISGRFVHLEAEEIAGAIEDALARVGEFMGVDRSYVFLYDTTGRTATNTHEWCAEGIPPQKADLQDVSKEEMGWSLGGLYEGRSLIVNELGDVPVEAGADRAVFQEGKIQSLLCVPMKVRGRVMGFVGCDCVRAQRSWSADEIRMLRVIAEVMANGLERERAEEALRREHHLATRLADTSPVGVVQIDGHGRITVANKRAEDLLELSRDERGAYCAPLWRVTTVDGADPPPQELPHIMIQLSRQPVHGLRQGIVWPDGRRMVVSVSGAPLIGPEGRFEGGVFSIEDITERLRIEEELQKSQRLESLGMLAGGIAHDFNNLLGGLFGYLDMAREECRAASPAAGELLDKALTGYQRARDLTQQLLTFAKGGAPVRRLASIAATVHEAASLALSGSTIVPSFTIADDVWDGEIDEGQISQVVNNLVINARHAMPRGGRLEVRCRNREIDDRTALAVAPGKYVEVTITDSGMGIPREHMGRIFDPFFTTKQQGSGLGLASAYSIVKKHGGDISVNSKLGRGTTFCVFLPAVAERTAKQSPKTVDERVRHGAGRVLLMDDEAVIVEMATELLKRLGYEVHSARHGEEALDAYRHARESGSPFDVVILDLTIAGGMGGLETIRKLREIDGDVRAIVSSGYAEDPAMADPEAYGFQGVVRKPYRIRDLSGVLARLLR
jgi:PAS domain S-box-containing protein